MASFDIELKNFYETDREEGHIIGCIVIDSPVAFKHNGIQVKLSGRVKFTVSPQNNSYGMMIYNKLLQPIQLTEKTIDVSPAGEIPKGNMKISFLIPILPKKGVLLYETYHGDYISIKYKLQCTVWTTNYLARSQTMTKEVIIQNQGKNREEFQDKSQTVSQVVNFTKMDASRTVEGVHKVEASGGECSISSIHNVFSETGDMFTDGFEVIALSDDEPVEFVIDAVIILDRNLLKNQSGMDQLMNEKFTNIKDIKKELVTFSPICTDRELSEELLYQMKIKKETAELNTANNLTTKVLSEEILIREDSVEILCVVTGFLDSDVISINKPLTGELTVAQNRVAIEHVYIELLVSETCGKNYHPDVSLIKALQIVEGNVATGTSIPFSIAFPTLITCPTVITDMFKIEYAIKIVMVLKNVGNISKTIPITIIRL